MSERGCYECGEEFRFDDTGGYNPPCECKVCQGMICRSCHQWVTYDDEDEAAEEAHRWPND